MKTELKSNWNYKKLNELGFVGRGKSRHRPRNDPSLYGGNYPFIQTGEVKGANLYISQYSQTYNEKGLNQSKLWNPGTILITIAANIAETAILKMKACFPDSIVGFIADPNKADIHFVKYYIDTIKLGMQNISKGTTQDNLSLEKLLTFKVYAPPLPMQQKIASILSAYDDLIEKNNRRIKILEEMAQTIYKEWFVNFRFPGHKKVKIVDSELGKIPERWEVKKLKDFGEIITGKTPSKKIKEYYGDYMPFVKTPDMHGNIFCIYASEYLSRAGVNSQKTKTLPPNSLCVSCIGTAGIVSIISEPSQTNQQINSIVFYDTSAREFLYFALIDMKDKIKQYGSAGATMVNLSKGKFENLNFLCPNSNLMVKFHHLTASMFDEIKALQYKNANLSSTRDLLLPRLISGEVDVATEEIIS